MGQVNELAHNPIIQASAVAATEGLAFVAFTTLYNHRELTHESIKLHPTPKTLARLSMWALGVKPRIWADVHRTHHSCPDANFVPIVETADYLDWRAENPDVLEPIIPAKFEGLDPTAIISPLQIMRIGSLARKLVENKYQPPENYTLSEAQRILDPITPRYFYQDKKDRGKKKNENIPEHLENLAPYLMDPHSPALHKQGVFGIVKHNVGLYRIKAKHSETIEKEGKNLGRDELDKKLFDRTNVGPVAFFAVNIALLTAFNRSNSKNKLIKSVLTGAAASTGAIYGLLYGGKITNAFGHGGDNIFASFFMRKPPKAKNDGTYTSDAKILNLPTLDEVGGQYEHHEDPSLIAYSFKSGLKRFLATPFGTTTEFLAKKNILLSRGSQFKGKKRPDIPSDAIRALENARRNTIRIEQTKF